MSGLLSLGQKEGGFADLKRVRADIDLVDAAGYGFAQVFVAGPAAAVQHEGHIQQRFQFPESVKTSRGTLW